jgi:ABC-type sugar transport system ATPase subunit
MTIAAPRRRRRIASGPSEENTQAAVVRWMELQHPDVAQWLHHSPNGGIRNKATAARLKAMGVRKGFPDLVLTLRRGGFVCLAIELKVGKNKATAEQAQWLDHLGGQGWMAVLCVGFEATVRTLADYMALPEHRA